MLSYTGTDWLVDVSDELTASTSIVLTETRILSTMLFYHCLVVCLIDSVLVWTCSMLLFETINKTRYYCCSKKERQKLTDHVSHR